jgi:tetratricopeptide (TPR) repeat protein
VYRSLIGFAGAEGFAVSSYEKAVELEPASPFNVTELGRVYVLKAQNLANQKGKEKEREEALSSAQEKLTMAIELKNDYAPAHFLVAVIYDQQGKTEEAIKKLEETKNASPQDSGLAFQLGVVYWQKQRYEKAQEEFERALKLNANYDNAKYMLGLVYDKRGQAEKANEIFTKLVETNPDNKEVTKILANLTAGKPALEDITPAQPPLEETPPEIQNPNAK